MRCRLLRSAQAAISKPLPVRRVGAGGPGCAKADVGKKVAAFRVRYPPPSPTKPQHTGKEDRALQTQSRRTIVGLTTTSPVAVIANFVVALSQTRPP